jgi:hypothetical protein
MIDKFLSGWGKAEGKNARYIYECESYQEAEEVEAYAKSRGDQKYVRININKPSKKHNCLDMYKTKQDSPIWYEGI